MLRASYFLFLHFLKAVATTERYIFGGRFPRKRTFGLLSNIQHPYIVNAGMLISLGNYYQKKLFLLPGTKPAKTSNRASSYRYWAQPVPSGLRFRVNFLAKTCFYVKVAALGGRLRGV